MAQRFGSAAPGLNAYGASYPAEFFAVSAQAYFVNRSCFEEKPESLSALFDTFLRKIVL